VRLVFEQQGEHGSQWAAIQSVAGKLGCTAETLRRWVRQAERDTGQRAGLTTSERDRVKALERENFELKRANEILRKAAAFFAQAELDRKLKS
jgi:transposase-like protein